MSEKLGMGNLTRGAVLLRSLAAFCVVAVVTPMAVLSQATRPSSPPDTASIQVREILRGLREARTSAPEEYAQAQVLIVFLMQMQLSQIGFAAPLSGAEDEGTKAALAQYRAARGLSQVDEVLDSLTLTRLFADTELFESTFRTSAPSTSFVAVDQWMDGYVLAEGPWRLDNDDQVRAVHVECVRARSSCSLVSAMQSASLGLRADLESYSIRSWDQFEIVSTPLDYACTRNVLRLNRAQQSVSVTRSALSTAGPCAALDSRDVVGRLLTLEELASSQRIKNQLVFDSVLNLTGAVRDVLGTRKPN